MSPLTTRAVLAAAAATFAAAGCSTGRSFNYFELEQQYPPTLCSSSNPTWSCVSHSPFFTLHGLWPQVSPSTWPCSCSGEAYTAATEQLPGLAAYWPSLTSGTDYAFHSHEWNAHGKCSGLSQRAYFEGALAAMRAYNITAALMAAGLGSTFTRTQFNAVTAAAFGVTPPIISCDAAGRIESATMCLDLALRVMSCPAGTSGSCSQSTLRLPDMPIPQAAASTSASRSPAAVPGTAAATPSPTAAAAATAPAAATELLAAWRFDAPSLAPTLLGAGVTASAVGAFGSASIGFSSSRGLWPLGSGGSSLQLQGLSSGSYVPGSAGLGFCVGRGGAAAAAWPPAAVTFAAYSSPAGPSTLRLLYAALPAGADAAGGSASASLAFAAAATSDVSVTPSTTTLFSFTLAGAAASQLAAAASAGACFRVAVVAPWPATMAPSSYVTLDALSVSGRVGGGPVTPSGSGSGTPAATGSGTAAATGSGSGTPAPRSGSAAASSSGSGTVVASVAGGSPAADATATPSGSSSASGSGSGSVAPPAATAPASGTPTAAASGSSSATESGSATPSKSAAASASGTLVARASSSATGSRSGRAPSRSRTAARTRSRTRKNKGW